MTRVASRLVNAPDRRIEGCTLIDACDVDAQRSTSGGVIVMRLASRALDPLDYPVVVHAFDSAQRVSMKGDSPCHWTSNVSTKVRAVNAYRRVGERRYRKPSQARPEQCRRWDQSPNHVWPGGDERISDQDG